MPFNPIDAIESQVNVFTDATQDQTLEAQKTSSTSALVGTGQAERPTRAVAIAPDGKYVVVWSSYGQDSPGDTSIAPWGIYAQLYNADGTRATADPVLVNTFTKGTQVAPSVGMDASGNFVVTWSGKSNPGALNESATDFGVYARRFSNTGQAVDAKEFRVNALTTADQASSTVTVDSQGNFVIAWSSKNQDSLGNNGIFVQRYDKNGVAQYVDASNKIKDLQANTFTDNNQQSSSVAVTPDGSRYVVVWESVGQDGQGYGIYAQIFDANGNPLYKDPVSGQVTDLQISAYQSPNPPTGQDQRLPSVGIAANGDFVVAWTGGGPGDSQGVFARRFNANGTAKDTQEFRVNKDSSPNQVSASVAMNSTGDFIISWSDNSNVNEDIFARFYKSTDTPTSAEDPFQLNANPADLNEDQTFPAVALNDNKQIVGVWTTIDPNTGSEEVAARRFNYVPLDIALSASSVNEGNAPNTTIATLSPLGIPGTVTYSLVTGDGSTDNGSFKITGNQLILTGIADFEQKNTYAIRIKADNGAGTVYERPVTITVNDINEQPTGVSLLNATIDEAQPIGSLVGQLVGDDPDTATANRSFVYQLIDGTGATDNSKFQIVGSELRTNAVFDYETKSSYSIRVKITDQNGAGKSFEEVILVNVNNINETPNDITIDKVAIDEGSVLGTTVGSFSTTDPDKDTNFIYTLTNGFGDNNKFTIVGNQLKINSIPDFETQPSYSIEVKTDDQKGGTFTKVFTISVNDLNEAPTDLSLSNNNVDENLPAGTVVGSLIPKDLDSAAINGTFVYTFIDVPGVTENDKFQIIGNQLVTAGPFDFEGKSSYTVGIRVTDQNGTGKSFDKQLVVKVNDVFENLPPTGITLTGDTINENVDLGTLVGTLATQDPNTGDTFVYQLVDGFGDNSSFTLVGNQLFVNGPIDYEAKQPLQIKVKSTDQNGAGASIDQSFTIKVNDINEAPTDLALSKQSVDETLPIGTSVGTFSAIDPDSSTTNGTFVYTLVTGDGDTDNAKFTIVNGALQTNAIFDYEATKAYSIRVRVTDQGGAGKSFEKPLTITINNVNEAPTDIQLLPDNTIDENIPPGVIATLGSTDPDGDTSFTYTLVDGAGSTDNSQFTLAPDGQLSIINSPNFEQQSDYFIRVRSTDAGGKSVEKQLTINVNDLPDAPGGPTNLTLSPQAIDEGLPPGAVVGTFTTTDPDSTDFSYTLDPLFGDASKFFIENGQLKLKETLDFETKATYSIRVTTKDPTDLPLTRTFTISVNNVNEAPTELLLSNDTVSETFSITNPIGTFSTTDPDLNDPQTYTLGVGGDNDAFVLVGNQLKFKNPPDFEVQSSYSIQVTSTDKGGKSITKPFIIQVTNVNELPTGISLSKDTIDENVDPNTIVGQLTTADPDTGDLHTYTIDTTFGDGAKFTISGDSLLIKEFPDYEIQPSYSVRVTSTDSGGKSISKDFTIKVNNLPENPGDTKPRDILLSNDRVNENVVPNSVIGSLSTIDPDQGDTHTYTIDTTFGDGAKFTLNGTQLVLKESPNYEQQQQYVVRVTSTDIGGKALTKDLIILVNDLPEKPGENKPTDILLSSDRIDENVDPNTLIGTLSTVDPDQGDTHTYTIDTTFGDGAKFTLNGNQIVLKDSPDYEKQPQYVIRVTTTDIGGNSFTKDLTILVNNLPENPGDTKPTDILLSNNRVDENVDPNSVIGTLSSVDPDQGDTQTYTIDTTFGDGAKFTLNGSQLVLKESPDYEKQKQYTVRITSTDVGGKTLTKDLIVQVNDLPENPGDTKPTDILLSNNRVDENVDPNSVIGTLSTADPDQGDTHTYTIDTTFGDGARFTLNGNQLILKESPDFEQKAQYIVRITSTDIGGKAFTKDVTILVNDLPEKPGENKPTDIQISNNRVDENVDPNTLIGTLSTVDPDQGDTHTYSLDTTFGDGAKFTLNGNQLVLKNSPDYEQQPQYIVRITTTDVGGKAFTKDLIIQVNDLPEKPGETKPTDILLSNNQINENADPNSLIGTLSTIDPDQGDTHTYTIDTTFGDGAKFTLNGSQLVLKESPDYEKQKQYTIRITSTDVGGKALTKDLIIQVNDLPEKPGETKPTDILLSNNQINENADPNSLIGTLSTVDPDAGDTHTYSLDTTFGDGAKFTLNGNQLVLKASPDYEIQKQYTIRITSTDVGGKALTKDLIIQVNDLPEKPGETKPTDILLSNNRIDENVDPNSLIGTLSTVDPDAGDTHTYSLDTTFGDGAKFTLNGTQLVLKETPDYEKQKQYVVRITSTDVGGKALTKDLIVQVNDLPEKPGETKPTDIQLSNNRVDENVDPNSVIGTLTTIDPDQGDTHTYTIDSTFGDGAKFTLNGNQLVLKESPDYEKLAQYAVRVTSTDVGGKTFTKDLIIQVNDLPEKPGDTKPTDILLSNDRIDEGAVANSPIGIFSTIDPDQGDAHTYTIDSTFGDGASFTLNGQQLILKDAPNFEFKNRYTIRITSRDIGNKSFTKDFTIQVNDINEAPIVTLSGGTSPSFIEKGSAVTVDAGLTLRDDDSPNLTQATVAIANYVPGQDQLGFINGNGITGTFNPQTGVLTLTGSASLNAYQSALRSVTYSNTSNNPDLTDRLIRFSVKDAALDSNTATRTVRVVPVDDPSVVATSGGSLVYGENSGAVTIDAGVTVNDVDSVTLSSATVTIVNYVKGQDSLKFTNRAGITGSFDDTAGVLTLTGNASVAAYQDILRSVTYTNSSDAPAPLNRTIAFAVKDGSTSSNVATRTIQITPTNTAPVVTTSPDAASYVENSAPVVLDAGFTVLDAEADAITQAVVKIVNYLPIEDQLGFTNQNGITGQFDGKTGILTLTGTASLANYQAALRSITYLNTQDNPNLTNRIVQITVKDGSATSNAVTRTVQITPINDAPVVKPSAKTVTFSRAIGAVAIDPAIVLSDVDSANLAGATIQLKNYVADQDALIFNDQNGITGNFNVATGTLTLSGAASVANYQAALRSIIYLNSSDRPNTQPRNIEISATDGLANSNVADAKLQILFEQKAGVPVVDLNGNAEGINFTNVFTINDSTFPVANPPIPIVGDNMRLIDEDSATFSSAQIAITNPYDWRFEDLTVDTRGTGITASYQQEKGILTLNGTASIQSYLKVFRSLRYQNRATNPDTTTRVLLFWVNDGKNRSESAQTMVQISDVRLGGGGEPQGESLNTTPATDLITTGKGNDIITSTLNNLQQNDKLKAGDGYDTFQLRDGVGTVSVTVDRTPDQIAGIFTGNTKISQFEYFDLSGFKGQATLMGSDRLNDKLSSGAGNDRLLGRHGNDRLISSAGNDTLDGGKGNDTLMGGAGDDRYFVDNAKDIILESPKAGFDRVYASSNFQLRNNLEDLTLQGKAIRGTGNGLGNKLVGNRAANTLLGQSGNDMLYGYQKNDRLEGGKGDDLLAGGKGNDRLVGGDGNDTLNGGSGKDAITTGKGRDQIFFTTRTEGKDTIKDFRHGQDRIAISQQGFKSDLQRGQLADDRFTLGSRAETDRVRFVFNESKGALFFDPDGSGKAKAIELAQLGKGVSLTSSDIWVMR